MSQLKPSFVAEVQESLRNSVFTAEDFELVLPESGKTLFRITFVHRPSYLLECKESTRRESYTVKRQILMESREEQRTYSAIEVLMVPGQYKSKNTIRIGDLGEVISIIPDWCKYLRADLHALVPKPDPVAEIRARFKKDIEDGIEEPDSYFSEEELTSISTRLDEMVTELESLKDEYAFTKKQLDAIKQDVESFKSDAAAYPKGLWAKTTSNRFVQWVRTFASTPEGKKFLFDLVRKFLPGPDA